jgi:hypothetical protein
MMRRTYWPWNANRHAATIPLLTLLALVIFSSPTLAQTRRAVLVGVNTYVPADTSAKSTEPSDGPGAAARGRARGKFSNLEGSLNDVESIHQLLVTRYGFAEKNVQILVENKATHDDILHAIQIYLADAASPGDIGVFYYAGHGSQMKNSKSWKLDKLDETTVPADSYKGVSDIRDKEYARAFMKVIDKGVILTAIFDSCHSGSVTRGYSRFNRVRSIDPDPGDSMDDYSGPFPEMRGALVFAAAQDTESAAEGRDDNGVDHGAFTAALIKVMSSVPPNESANDIFQQAFALMRSAGASQVPVISGTEARIRGPLFGASGGSISGKLTLPIVTADGDTDVELFGGLTLGFGVGSELVPADNNGPAAGVRLKVTEQSPSKSTAQVLSGSADKLTAGMLFVVDRWVPAGNGVLSLWIPPPTASLEDLRSAASAIEKIGAVPGITVVKDPYEVTPTHVISWDDSAWVLTDQATGAAKSLGRKPDFVAVAKSLPSGKAKVFVNLPLPQEASQAIARIGTAESPTRVVKSVKDANYLLVGRVSESGVEYSWLLPGASKDASTALEEFPDKNGHPKQETIQTASSLPAETRWVSARITSDGFDGAVAELTEMAGNLARIYGWLRLPSPPDDGGFPYHLEVVESNHLDSTEPIKTAYGDGRSYGLVLRANKSDLGSYVGQQRRVYVFVIDSDGNGVPLFPPVVYGDVQNVFPLKEQTNDGPPLQIALGPPQLFKVSAPFGTDTYFLLTTAREDSINLLNLKWEGVRGSRGVRGGGSPLDQLLSSVGTRGATPVTPSSWSLQRLAIQSAPKP